MDAELLMKSIVIMKKMSMPCIHCGGPKRLYEHLDSAKEVDVVEQRCMKCGATGTLERGKVDARMQIVSDAMREQRMKFREDMLDDRDRKGII